MFPSGQKAQVMLAANVMSRIVNSAVALRMRRPGGHDNGRRSQWAIRIVLIGQKGAAPRPRICETYRIAGSAAWPVGGLKIHGRCG